jgi:hypothetical protein
VMSNYATYDPADFTVDDLMRAARGDTRAMAASLAVELLRVKVGVDTESTMAGLAQDESADPRARRTATLALADYPDSAPLLRRLVAAPDRRIAEAARTALSRQG